MRAAIFNGKNNISIEDVQIPQVGENDVLIKVMACGICGTDVHIYEGAEGAAQTIPPLILGHEFTGVVEKIGSQVKGVVIGDRVSVDPNKTCGICTQCKIGNAHFCENMIGYGTTVHGGFAQYCVVHHSQIYPLGNLSFEEGAMAEPIACCLHGIDCCNIKTGSTVLIIGGGAIGLIMLQLAKCAGATKIIVSEPIREKRNMAERLGADMVINPLDNIDTILQESNIDVVIECVGLKNTMLDAIKYAGIKSTIMLFGLGNPSDEIPIKPFDIFKRELTIKGSFINPYTQKRAIDILKQEKINVNILSYKTIPLDDLNEALHSSDMRSKGKIFVNPWI